jgi:hypothetical protein
MNVKIIIIIIIITEKGLGEIKEKKEKEFINKNSTYLHV